MAITKPGYLYGSGAMERLRTNVIRVGNEWGVTIATGNYITCRGDGPDIYGEVDPGCGEKHLSVKYAMACCYDNDNFRFRRGGTVLRNGRYGDRVAVLYAGDVPVARSVSHATGSFHPIAPIAAD